MKSKLTVLLLFAIAALSIACQPQLPSGLARFRDMKLVSVVLNYNDWNYIFMTRPDYLDAGFSPILRKGDLSEAFDRCHVPRDFAVVTIGWKYTSEKLATVTSEWKKILKGNEFRRVALVHGDAWHLRKSYLIEEAWP